MRIPWKIIAPLVVLLIFIWVAIGRFEGDSDLRRNGVLVEALIIDVLPSGKATASPSFKCEFRLEGKIITAISSSSIKGNIFSYVGKKYPALYAERTHTLRLLLTRADYNKFRIPYNDKLK